MMSPTVIAIVPIKHNSTRVPRKNFRKMVNKPLFHWVLQTLSNIKEISQIIVNTDSAEIKNELKIHFPNITIYDRPEELHGDSVSTNDLLLDTIKSLDLKADLYLQTHVTNPLLKEDTIIKAINVFTENQEKEYDSVFTVKTHHTRFYNSKGKELNHDRFNLIPTQDLEPIYEENSCVYIFTRKVLEELKSRIGNNPYLLPMGDIESTDIDWPDDFLLAEQLLKLTI